MLSIQIKTDQLNGEKRINIRSNITARPDYGHPEAVQPGRAL